MNKKNFIKELKDYFSIFAFVCIIFTVFQNNMSFAGGITCSEFNKEEHSSLQHCRPNDFTVAQEYDVDGNKPVTCSNAKLDSYNPYKDDEYYYESKNKWCLAWALGISITYSVASIAGSYACTAGGAPTNAAKTAQKAAKVGKFKKFVKVVKEGFSVGTQLVQTTALSVLTNPIIALQIDFGLDAVSIIVKMGINGAACAGEVGMGPHCSMLVSCAVTLGVLTALSQTLIWATTFGLYESARMQFENIKVCGDDWSSYAYTWNDMKEPEQEWYPQYGSFSNSYSYKIQKVMSGDYSCEGYLKNQNVFGGRSNLETKAAACNCENEVKECLKKNRKSNGEADIEKCSAETSGCSSYCRGYYLKCVPMLSVLDVPICVESSKEGFTCKNVKPKSKSIKNRLYREYIYKGKEFRISRYGGNHKVNCYDPRLAEDKGYAGTEQRYYFRGKESAQYSCSRFKYKNNGCRIMDGDKEIVITRDEAATDESKALRCKQAFAEARSCCQNRRASGICIYAKTGKNAGRDTNTMCLRSLDSSEDAEVCGLPTGETSIRNPYFAAETSQYRGTDICIKNVNFCPYTYNVAGGTEFEDLYCDGDYLNCKNEADKRRIWKANKYRYPTAAYGQTKNFCHFRSHCTEIGDDDYEFADMPSNKFLPKVCSDFIGDSQNLPYPVRLADVGGSSIIRKIYTNAGVSLGDESKKQINAAIDKMTKDQLVKVYSGIIADKTLISLVSGLVGASVGGPIAGIVVGASVGGSYAAEDIKKAVYNDKNAKDTLKSITNDMINKPLISMDFSMGAYRGFTAPIAQCVRETLYNMFHNIAGQSFCKDSSEEINSEGLCGRDTFGPPARIRSKNYDSRYTGVNDAYYYVMGDPLPDDSNILHKLQSRLQLIIKIAAVLAIIVIGFKFLMKGDLDIFNDNELEKPKAMIVGMLKFAIVFYFAVGDAWQTKFYDWIDRGTQYLYYKAFDLSLVGYKEYKNQTNVMTCSIEDTATACRTAEVTKEEEKVKTFGYTGGVQQFVVPDGVTKVGIKVWGAQGGSGNDSNKGGRGGYSYGTLSVTPGKTLYIYVGGAGGTKTFGGAPGGYNGGGASGTGDGVYIGGGGGATDVRYGGTSTINRVIVAGGGGGSVYTTTYGVGGYGGGGNSTGKYSYMIYSNGSSNGVGGDGESKSTETPGAGGAGGGGGYLGGSGGVCRDADTNRYESGGGGGVGYIGGVTAGGGENGVNEGNGKAEITYTLLLKETKTVCEEQPATVRDNVKIENLSSLPVSLPEFGKKSCTDKVVDINGSIETTRQTCYSDCKEVPNFDEDGNKIYEFSDRYDGCYFGDSIYPYGKEYLSIFDSLDCKLMNYLGYGPEIDLPGVLHMILISLFFSPLALVTVILGSILFVIMLIIVYKVLYIFLMSIIAINVLIYMSPLIFPMMLFEKYKSIFDKWLGNLMGFCLQFVLVVVFAGFFIGSFERLALGSARFVNHDPTTGRLPTTICGDSVDSILCIFKVNTNKGTKPLLGEKITKFLGIGPVVSVVDSISRDFTGTVMTLLKFCLITYVLMQFLNQIPSVAAKLVGGKALDGGSLSFMKIMGGIADITNKIARGAKGLMKKGANSLKGAGNKAKEKVKRSSGSDYGKGGGEGGSDDKGGLLKAVNVRKRGDSGDSDLSKAAEDNKEEESKDVEPNRSDTVAGGHNDQKDSAGSAKDTSVADSGRTSGADNAQSLSGSDSQPSADNKTPASEPTGGSDAKPATPSDNTARNVPQDTPDDAVASAAKEAGDGVDKAVPEQSGGEPFAEAPADNGNSDGDNGSDADRGSNNASEGGGEAPSVAEEAPAPADESDNGGVDNGSQTEEPTEETPETEGGADEVPESEEPAGNDANEEADRGTPESSSDESDSTSDEGSGDDGTEDKPSGGDSSASDSGSGSSGGDATLSDNGSASGTGEAPAAAPAPAEAPAAAPAGNGGEAERPVSRASSRGGGVGGGKRTYSQEEMDGFIKILNKQKTGKDGIRRDGYNSVRMNALTNGSAEYAEYVRKKKGVGRRLNHAEQFEYLVTVKGYDPRLFAKEGIDLGIK